MQWLRAYSGFAAAIFALSAASTASIAASTTEEALLAGNWSQLAKLIEQERSDSTDPVDSLLMAHAMLATNKNTASYALFVAVRGQDELAAWAEWTNSFRRQHPKAAIGHYLFGDAQARLGNWDEAIKSLSAALDVNSSFGLAHNARGVAHAIAGNLDAALIDFHIARQLVPTLADAHANFGTLAVLREFSLSQGDGALKALDEAISLNPDFALAYNSRGSLLFGSGEFELAADDFRTARRLAPFLLASDLNESFAYSYANTAVTLASVDVGAGTTIQSVIRQRLDTSSVTPTPVLDAIAKHRQVQSGSSGRNPVDGIAAAKFRDTIERFTELSPAEQSIAVEYYGRPAIVTGLALREENLRLQQATRLQEIGVLNDTVPGQIRELHAVRRQEVFLNTAVAGLGAAAASATGGALPALGVTVVGAARSKAGEELQNRGHRGWARVVELAPLGIKELSGSILGSALSVRTSLASNNLDKTNGRIDLLFADHRKDQAELREIERVRSRLNSGPLVNAARSAPSDTARQLTMPAPIGIHATGNARLRDITDAVNRYVDPASSRSIVIVSSNPTGEASFSDRILQSGLNRLGHVATIIPRNADLGEVTRSLQVQALVSSPTFPILQNKSTLPSLVPTLENPRFDTPEPELKRRHNVFPTSRTQFLPGPPEPPPVPLSSIKWHRIGVPTFTAPDKKVGGVLTKADAFVDHGNWPVLAGFGLAY